MIYFDHLPLADDILQALSLLQIEYAFQPIFYPDGETVFAREALMRPHGTTVTELINEYTEIGRLHVLEVATFFGAMQAYMMRGFTERISLNSFPSECFDAEEEAAFDEFFGDLSGLGIIEILEYPHLAMNKWETKKNSIENHKLTISLDDYGSGINDMGKVELFEPAIVKLDRSLISGIDTDVAKQENCEDIIALLHSQGRKVVAEGIETKEEFEFLVDLGADYFQGYYLGRPN